MKDLAVVVLVALGLVLAGRSCAQESAFGRELAYADSLKNAALDSLARVRARADSLKAEAETSDTVLVRVVDSVTVVIRRNEERTARADSSFASNVDSLRYRIASDPVAVQLLDGIVADHAETRAAADDRYRALEVRLGATEESLALWRTTAEGQERRAVAAEAALATAEAAIAVRDDALAARSRKAWYERGIAVAVVAVAVLR